MKIVSKVVISVCMAVLLCLPISLFMDTANVSAASMKLSAKSIVLIKGQKKTLKVKGTKKKVKWKTSKKSVATVSQKGVVTAKGKGSATITATVSGKKLKCKVKVETPSLNQTSVVLPLGRTYSLKAKGTSQKVQWNSKNKSIAIVNSKGVVTPKKTGSTKVTATVLGKKYTCKIKVVSLQKNYTKLKNYIQKSGTFDQDGNPCIQYSETQQGATYTCQISYEADQDRYKFLVDLSDGDDSNRCIMYLNLEKSDTAIAEISLLSLEDGSLTGQGKFNAFLYSDDTEVKFYIRHNLEGIDQEDAQDFCNLELYLFILVWDDMLKENVHISLQDLGFASLDFDL